MVAVGNFGAVRLRIQLSKGDDCWWLDRKRGMEFRTAFLTLAGMI